MEFIDTHKDLRGHPMIADYIDYCGRSFKYYGESAYAQLITREHFTMWLRLHKGDDKERMAKDSILVSSVFALLQEARGSLNRARSYMQLPDVMDMEEPADEGCKAPPCKKPTMADVVEQALEKPMRPVPSQGNASKKPPAAVGVVGIFGDYNLEELQVPPQAWPVEGHVYKGTKSYTVRSRSGAVPWFAVCVCFMLTDGSRWVCACLRLWKSAWTRGAMSSRRRAS